MLGGIRDPFSLEFEVDILGSDGIKHRSSERYYWYKMAETFNDSVLSFINFSFVFLTLKDQIRESAEFLLVFKA